MIVKCDCQRLFGADCQYDGNIDTDKQAYSVRKLDSQTYYYHYLCYVRDAKEIIAITPKHKKRLCTHLIGLKDKGYSDTWINGVLFACGYKYNGE